MHRNVLHCIVPQFRFAQHCTAALRRIGLHCTSTYRKTLHVAAPTPPCWSTQRNATHLTPRTKMLCIAPQCMVTQSTTIRRNTIRRPHCTAAYCTELCRIAPQHITLTCTALRRTIAYCAAIYRVLMHCLNTRCGGGGGVMVHGPAAGQEIWDGSLCLSTPARAQK